MSDLKKDGIRAAMSENTERETLKRMSQRATTTKEALEPIYVASRASIPERGAMWRQLRAEGIPITSSWIDEDGEGETASFVDLWDRIYKEIAAASALVLYAERDDFPLKGALIEAGIALGMGKPVIVCLPDLGALPRNYRPVGSWVAHPLVSRRDEIRRAVDLATRSRVPAPSVAPEVDTNDVARSCEIYAEMIESQNDLNGQTENWQDFYRGQHYAAKQLADAFRCAAPASPAAPVGHTVECDVWIYPNATCTCAEVSAALRDEAAQCYWCKHPAHEDKICPVPYLARGESGIEGSYPCGCSQSTVIGTAAPPSTLAKAAAEEILSAFPGIKEHDKRVTLLRAAESALLYLQGCGYKTNQQVQEELVAALDRPIDHELRSTTTHLFDTLIDLLSDLHLHELGQLSDSDLIASRQRAISVTDKYRTSQWLCARAGTQKQSTLKGEKHT